MGQRRLSAPSYHPRPEQPEGAGKVLSWLAACAPSWLVTPPDNVPAKDAKLYRTRVSLVALGGAVHLVLLSVYALFGYVELCGLNILVLGYYCLCLALGRSGRHHLALILAVSEALVHLCCFALIVDLNAGYALYFFNTATAAFLGYRASEPLGRYVLFFANIGAMLLVVIAQPFVSPSVRRAP